MSYGLLFLAAVLAEVASLVIMGSWLGALPTFGLLVVAFVIGTSVLRGRGIATVKGALLASSQGESVAPPLIDGALLALAGLLFVVPGFASDAVAILLVLPPVRGLAARRVTRWLQSRLPRTQVDARDAVIDVESTEVHRPDEDQPRLP